MRLQIQPRTVIINLITAFALALMLEAVIGLGLRNPQRIPGFITPYLQLYYLSQDRSIIQVTPCAQYDEELFYLLKPGECRFSNREFEVTNQINSQGLRDDEESLKKPEVIVFGDSFTLGWGVAQEKSYPQVLEGLLNMKVLNAGMSSFGTAREMILKERLDLSETKKIIIQYHPNDLEENFRYVNDGFHLKVRSRYSYDSLTEKINDRTGYFLLKHLMGISKAFAQQMIPKRQEAPSDTVHAEFFLRILKHSGLPKADREVIVFKIDKSGQNNDAFADALEYWLLKPEFSGMKITSTRITTSLDGDDYFILDDHINERGHTKIANRLKDYFSAEAGPVLVDKNSGM